MVVARPIPEPPARPAHVRRRVRGGVSLCAVALVTVSACSSGQSSSSPNTSKKKVAGSISVAFLQKQADQQYFIDEANGAKAEAKKLGVKVSIVNLGTDSNKAISEVQQAISQKVNGIIIVPPDPSVGPQVNQLAQRANVSIISSDDQVCTTGPNPDQCSRSKLLPRVGFDGTQMGNAVGKEAAALFKKESGWTAGNTRVLAEWQQSVTVCTQRVKAAQSAFKQDTGVSIPVIQVGTDNTPSGAQSKTAATVNANRGVKHWIVWGCNDENVQGATTALQNASYSASNIIAVGLGAYLACKDWESSNPTGMKAALFINGVTVGKYAIQTIYTHLKKGTPLPFQRIVPTKMVTPANWKSSGLVCH